MDWSLWFFTTRPKPTCQTCRDDQLKGIKKDCPGIDWIEKCPLNHVPKLAQGNVDFVTLFLRIQPGLFDGMGGLNYGSITTVFDVYRVDEDLRQTYFDKCLICIKAITQNQAREREHAKHKAKPNRK